MTQHTEAHPAPTERRIVGAVKVGDRFFIAGDEQALADALRPVDLERLKAADVIVGDWTMSERDDDDVDRDTHTKQPPTAPGTDDDDDDVEYDDDDDDVTDAEPVVPDTVPADKVARTRTPQPQTPPTPKAPPTPVPPVPKVPPVPTPTPTPPRSHKRKT